MSDDFKETNIEKIKWGTVNWSRKNGFKLLFFRYLFKKSMLSAYMENTVNGEKVLNRAAYLGE
jgi:hypothetical protein